MLSSKMYVYGITKILSFHNTSVLQELDFIICTRGEGHDILGQGQGEG